jgi:glucose-1-phosphate thymidylyltransferase
MKNGIILAGGTGSRLFPLTHVVNKHLLGVNGKFILDYPINTLKAMGVENLTVIMGGDHFSQVVDHLKDGRAFGMNCNYVYQGEARGIAQAVNLCERYVSDDDFVVILGDNIYENPIRWNLPGPGSLADEAAVVLHKHPELHRFGVASISGNKIVHIEEKPKTVREEFDNYAITGCYKFTPEYFDFFQEMKPSARGEYEITDIIRKYNEKRKLDWVSVDGMWSDAGTHESISYVNNFFYHKEHNA